MLVPRWAVLSRTSLFALCLGSILGTWDVRPCHAYPPFTIEVADNGGFGVDVGAYTSIKVDASNNPHISYYDRDNGNLKYAHKSGGVWSSEPADAAAADVG
jgi:hypothetical protein